MKLLSMPRTAALLIIFVPLHGLLAQQPAGPDSPSVDAPEWLVWRAFHESLRFYEERSPDVVADLLKDRAGLEELQQITLMSAGSAYISVLDAIDNEVRRGIFSRYGEQLAPQTNVDIPKLLRPEAGEPTRGLLPRTTRDGRDVKELLRADGTTAELEARRTAALQKHLTALRQSLGDEVLSKVEKWVSAEVAPNVHATTIEPIAPMHR